MQRTIRNGPSEEANAETADEASDKTIGALACWVSYSTGSALESKWFMLRVRNSIFRWYGSYCISVLTTNMHRERCSLQIAEDKTICINPAIDLISPKWTEL